MASLDLQRLRCFLAVAEEKHFARAAARLNMTPPPLSRQIKQLERELGGQLFVRGYHDIELTPLGESLVEPVRRALAAVDAVGTLADELSGRDSPLRVGATPFAPTPFLDGFLELLRGEGVPVHDEVVLEFGSSELAKRIVAGALDLALVHLPPPDDTLASMAWNEYRLAIAVRNDDPLAGAESVTMAGLRGRKVVHPLGRLHPKILEDHRHRLEAAGIEAVLDMPGPVGLAEIATQVWSRRLASFVPDVPGTLLGRVFSAPEFVTIPVSGEGLVMRLGIVWSPASKASPIALRRALSLLRNAATPPPAG
ncbi:LysR family transcriptional regulator [Microbacterium sp. No. 7]|uniref:LysR family transcriptional regulator n=1 Tax=Microbacterium sp. No. 7 TaxID=1714373 RepID=UPI0006CFA396|nr:LysR family transcriptional regulator [Microbacterium sp. No. 7]